MLSASPGSLSKRYRSAFSKAAGIASLWSDFSSGMAIGWRARSDAPYLGRAGSPLRAALHFRFNASTLQRFYDQLSSSTTSRPIQTDRKTHLRRAPSVE